MSEARNKIIQIGMLAAGLVFMSGCNTKDMMRQSSEYYRWLPSEFPQGISKVDANTIKAHIKSRRIYDQFTTLASFDILKFDSEIAGVIADLRREKRSLSQEARDEIHNDFQRQLAEHRIFYVLADVRDVNHPDLHGENPEWVFSLEGRRGTRLTPAFVERVDLDQEMRVFFGPLLSPFKKSYRIGFSREAFDKMTERHVAGGDEMILYSLVIASAQVESMVDWFDIRLAPEAPKAEQAIVSSEPALVEDE